MAVSYSLHQPVHRFFPRLEGWEITLGKILEVFLKDLRQAFHAHPGRALHEWPIESEYFFHSRGDRSVDLPR